MTSKEYEVLRGKAKLTKHTGVNGKTAQLIFPDRTFTACAPTDMTARKQVSLACEMVEKMARDYYLG